MTTMPFGCVFQSGIVVPLQNGTNIIVYLYTIEGREKMVEVVIYTTQTCPKCEQLKKLLNSKGVAFATADMSTPEALTELKFNGVFTMTAPVLQIGDEFLTHKELFSGPDVNLEALGSIL
ncbi:glutaredoxin [Methanolobus bombayensis]|nr:glutaredoxin [Methanolobus bombayensis]